MSFILGALKKAERDRPNQQGPDIDQLITSGGTRRIEKSPRMNPTWVVFLFVAAAVLVWTAVAILNRDIQGEQAVSNPDSPERPLTREVLVSSPLIEAPAELRSVEIPASVTSTEDPVVSPPEPELPLYALSVEGVILFESAPERSRVFVNGQAFQVGDELTPGVWLQSIGAHEIEVRTRTGSLQIPH